jgi:thioredoxin reductase (NADPH)
MTKPAVFAVDDNGDSLKTIEEELHKRYADDYAIYCERSAPAALERLEELKESGDEVALLLAACWMREMAGADFLVQAHSLHPEARRGMLTDWGDQSAAGPVLRAVALGMIDGYHPKPWASPDESFHQYLSE